jgi:glycosyltransferase involved in cell wall biosynthesis
MVQVVVHTRDVVGDRMAGPGIRAFHLAEELRKHFPTTLISQSESGVVKASGPDGVGASDALRSADILIGQPARGFRRRRRAQRMVYDLFAPNVLELRELYGNSPNLMQRKHLAAEWWRLAYALTAADLLICGVAKQREFYAKLQAGDAPWIEVPFGIDLEETQACEKPRDNVAIWGGGLWEWLDPGTAVDAMVRLNDEGLRAKLLFLGRARPNRELVDRRRDDRVDALLARGRGHVSAEEWVPYRERMAWLRAAKVTIMLHRRTAEAEYAIRTRLFDAIAAAVPVIATRGGFAADLVEQERLGIVVPPEDADAVARAVRKLLTDDEFHAGCVQRLERLRPRFAWEVVTRPLVEAIMQWQT